ncbi:MAG: peptide chain release factor N(5)-glutamine methyltransferase [Aquihabitans sp.]
MNDDGTVTWRELLAETTAALSGIDGRPDQESRWMIEAASGHEGPDLAAGLAELATQRGVAHLDAMIARRLAGEPIQYVLGRWAFRTLDLLCDQRVLIPRPETEQVVEIALAELDEVLLARHGDHEAVAVDLGTGSGAIALSITVERPGTRVWAVEASMEAAAVARANLAGLGMAGGRVRLVEGSWFDGLPAELRGTVDLVVTNPPYIAEHEKLAPSVADWEPVQALISGPSGLEAYEALLADIAQWLAPGGAFVAEIGATQAAAVSALVAQAGLDDVRVEQDHAGHDRTVVARNPG